VGSVKRLPKGHGHLAPRTMQDDALPGVAVAFRRAHSWLTIEKVLLSTQDLNSDIGLLDFAF
jgi:hypothetical protein